MPSYCSITDQGATVRYLAVDATAEHTAETLVVLNTAPDGPDLTPTAPYWLRLGGASEDRYVSLAVGGIITISGSAPSIGTGITRPQGLILLDRWRTLWTVTLLAGTGSTSVSGWVPEGWVPEGWVPVGWSMTGAGLYDLTMLQEAFVINLPQGQLMQPSRAGR